MMIEKEITEENKVTIFIYRDKDNNKYFTPNVTLAHARAEQLGTNAVYAETYDVPPLQEKKY